MAFHHSPKVITDQLQLSLDAGDSNSYPGSGTTWYDLSKNGYHATLGSSVSYSATTFGGSLQTLNNAENTNQTIASNSFGNVYWNNFTFEIWFSNDGSQGGDPSAFGFDNGGITAYGARYNGTIQNWVNGTLHVTSAGVSSATIPTQLVYTGNGTVFTSYINTVQADTDTTLAYVGGLDQAQGTGFSTLTDGIGSSSGGVNNDDNASGYLHLFNPSSTTFVKHFKGVTNQQNPAVYSVNNYFAGYFNTTSAIDEIQFKMASGNIDSGDICLYGIA